jgi:hypothetical protein
MTRTRHNAGLFQSPVAFTRPIARFGLLRRRAGSMLAELAMTIVLLIIAMTLVVKVLGWVAHERRAADRRERAVMEVANLMERITAQPLDEVTQEWARRLPLSEAARQSLPGSELAVEIDGSAGLGPRPVPAKRIAIRLRWRGSSGEWDAPVRLTSWIHARRKGS